MMIIHFTKKFGVLEKIVHTTSLKLRYCSEHFNVGSKKISNAAHPMICFSEYSLNELKGKHISYGAYGIAFKESWAVKNELNPVLYVESTSQIAQGLGKLLKMRKRKAHDKFQEELRLPVMQLKCFTKNISGYNSNLKIENFNFRNEREWRYVPTKKQIGGGYISQNYSTYIKNKDKHNRKLKKYPLRFCLEDIEAIFVSNENEANTLASNRNIDPSIITISNWLTDQ